VSRYLLNKFLYTVDRDADLIERYRREPEATVRWWEDNRANEILGCAAGEASTWLRFEPEERAALESHDYVALFRLGAHPFLTLTLFIALFERDHQPLGFQRQYARALAGFTLPYPDVET
jgi:hypothetical protein